VGPAPPPPLARPQGWLTHFPREDLLVLFWEDYVASPRAVASAVCSFLDVAPPLDNQLWANMSAAERHLPPQGSVQPMLPAARRLLDAFFSGHNANLGRQLGLPGGASPWAAGSRGVAAAAALADAQARRRFALGSAH
jgi:hypothetical protein